MRHGSLFSGIGGFDLAAEWMGWENVFHCEWNPFGQKVLKHYWPNSESFSDITKTDFKKYENTIDIITGGFPCQPYSLAGKRKGKEDDRHLWPQMLRCIQEIKPRWIVGENVYGLVNWDGGLVFHEVQTDLEAQGYEVQAFLLPACAVNAPHRRDRIWFIAHCNNNGFNECNGSNEVNTSKGRINAFGDIGESNGNGITTDSNSNRLQGRIFTGKNNQQGWDRQEPFIEKFTNKFRNVQTTKWESFPTVSPICDGNDGLSDRLDFITFSKWRKQSIMAGGNAVVPQLVHQIFKAIEAYEDK